MTETDYTVLKELASACDLEFDKAQEKCRQMQKAFMCLRDLGLIEKPSSEPLKKEDIEELPSPNPNLKTHIVVSPRGRHCLALIERYSQNNQPTVSTNNNEKQVLV
jgi:hypothetical protein